jgi:hypothetical protein
LIVSSRHNGEVVSVVFEFDQVPAKISKNNNFVTLQN